MYTLVATQNVPFMTNYVEFDGTEIPENLPSELTDCFKTGYFDVQLFDDDHIEIDHEIRIN